MKIRESHVAVIRKSYNITDQLLKDINDLMQEVRTALDGGQEYDLYMFEQKMRAIVKAPEDMPEYDHHMVQDIARAFAEDGKWEEIYLTLYRDDPSEKNIIKDWENTHSRVLQ